MKLKRFYFEPHNRHNNEIVLTEDEFLHAVTVLRIRVGEEVVAFCGDGFDYYCKVKNIAKKELTLEMVDNFIDYIEVYENNNIKINFKFRDEYKDLLNQLKEVSYEKKI